MSYSLDGIRTAMTDTSTTKQLAHNQGQVVCPCGWTCTVGEFGTDAPARLRFHYTHCPKAKYRDYSHHDDDALKYGYHE